MGLEVIVRFECEHCGVSDYQKSQYPPDFWEDIMLTPEDIPGWNVPTKLLDWPYNQLDDTEFENQHLFCPECVGKIQALLGLQ